MKPNKMLGNENLINTKCGYYFVCGRMWFYVLLCVVIYTFFCGKVVCL